MSVSMTSINSGAKMPSVILTAAFTALKNNGIKSRKPIAKRT